MVAETMVWCGVVTIVLCGGIYGVKRDTMVCWWSGGTGNYRETVVWWQRLGSFADRYGMVGGSGW